MNRRLILVTATLCCALVAPASASQIPEGQCAALAMIGLKDIEIVSATSEAANVPIMGAFQAAMGGVNSGPVISGLPPFCRVVARAHPTPDSDIDFEVWLPQQNWDGRLLGAGNGGYAGSISYYMLSGAVRAGQASFSTDTGHHGESGDSSWAPGHPEKVRDFGWRAIHVTTVAAKALVARYYGRPADHSYFDGYSNGGRQALVEASRFPDDYDGVLAGAPALDWTQTRMTGEWVYRAQLPPQTWIRPEQAKLLQAEVLRQCDKLDGQFDGLIDDPRRCHIDTSKLACGVSTSADCFTPQQLTALALIYAGHKNRKGQWTALPLLAAGSEVHDPLFGWDSGVFLGRSLAAHADLSSPDALLRQPVAALDGNAIATTGDFDFDRDAARYKAANAFGGLDASPDLRRFFARGGKLILWQGWADISVAPEMTIAYRNAVLRIAGKHAVSSMRLFMIPGMQHGVGGKGADMFGQIFPPARDAAPDSNIAVALQAWVETGRVPDSVIGKRHSASAPDDGAPAPKSPMERLICAYPMRAVLRSGADPDLGTSYRCLR